MAMKQLTGAPERADHDRPTALSLSRPTAPSSRALFAEARRFEQSARSVSVRLAARGFLASEPAGTLAEMQAERDSLYVVAAAYRSAGRRRERAERRSANWQLLRQEPARFVRLTYREMRSTVRVACGRIIAAVTS